MTTLKIEEMSCSHCVAKIHNVLEEANIKHEITLENKTVQIEGDITSVNKVIEELDDIGYTAIIE